MLPKLQCKLRNTWPKKFWVGEVVGQRSALIIRVLLRARFLWLAWRRLNDLNPKTPNPKNALSCMQGAVLHARGDCLLAFFSAVLRICDKFSADFWNLGCSIMSVVGRLMCATGAQWRSTAVFSTQARGGEPGVAAAIAVRASKSAGKGRRRSNVILPKRK